MILSHKLLSSSILNSIYTIQIFSWLIQNVNKEYKIKYTDALTINRMEIITMRNMNILTDKDKKSIGAGFPRNEFKNHTGLYGLKYYLVVMYLRKYANVFGEVRMTMYDFIKCSGYSTNTNCTNTCNEFKKIIIEEIINKGFATCSKDLESIKFKEMFSIYLSSSNNIFRTDKSFVAMTIDEYDKITSISDNTVSKPVLLGVYLFIKQYIYLCENSVSLSQRLICSGIGISSLNTVGKAIKILVDNNLLTIRTDLFVESSETPGNYIPVRNVYAISNNAYADEMVIDRLETVYGRKIYTKVNVPGPIVYNKMKRQY